MTVISHNYANHQLVSVAKFDTSIERVITRMWKVLRGKHGDTLLPTLIGIEVDYNGRDDAVPALRAFFDQLIKLRSKHFFRFITDTVWAAESKSGHTFYTHDGPKDNRCDAMWIVRVMGPQQVEIQVRPPRNDPRHGLVYDLANNMNQHIGKPCQDASPSTMHAIMFNCYTKTHRLYQTKFLEEPFHVLMTPTLTGNGFYPIPISGMSYDDARRHFKQVTDQQRFQEHEYYEYFKTPVSKRDLMHTLITLIQDTHRFDAKVNIAQERYALGELIFGMWATHHDCAESKHDMVLFNTVNSLHRLTDVYRYSMDQMYHNR